MQILLVEDNPADARLVQEALKEVEEIELNLECVDTLSAALTRVQKGDINLVLLDLGLPDSTGVDTVTKFCSEISNVPVIVLTGLHNETIGIEAVKQGAQDYLTKGHVYGNLLVRSMRYAIQRKQAEEALRESEKRFALFMDYLPACAFIKDDATRTLFVNKYMDNVFGAKDWLGKTVRELFSRNVAEKMMADDKRTLEIGYRTVIEDVPDKNGVNHTYQTHKFRIGRKSESPLLGGIAVDITERKKTEKALRIKNSALESSVSAIALADLDGNMSYVNPAFLEMWGYDNISEVLGKSVTSFWHSEEKAAEVAKRSLVEGGWMGELVAKRKDGSLFDVHLVASTVKGKSGKPLCNMASFVDITERRKAEEATRELEAQKLVVDKLKELESAKDEFISTVTHELRTPMTPLRSTIEMLLDGSLGELTDRQEKFIRMMGRNVERLAQFTTEVLTLSRLESGRYKLVSRMLSLREVLEPVAELMEQKALGKNSSVKLDIDAGISVYADADSLSIVVTNLTNNAIVHNPEGTTVNVFTRKLDKNLVELSVSDTGEGISEEALENLFDRFYQAKRKEGAGYQGTGVGLAVCKALVEAMGGEISVESRVGEGTTFRFMLPALPPQKEAREAKE